MGNFLSFVFKKIIRRVSKSKGVAELEEKNKIISQGENAGGVSLKRLINDSPKHFVEAPRFINKYPDWINIELTKEMIETEESFSDGLICRTYLLPDGRRIGTIIGLPFIN